MLYSDLKVHVLPTLYAEMYMFHLSHLSYTIFNLEQKNLVINLISRSMCIFLQSFLHLCLK